MRTTCSLSNTILLLWLGAAGCDAKTGDDYEGEPLLTLRGSVMVDGGEQPGRLVPALAFFNRQTLTVDLMDVLVEGSFPASFKLDVLVPPPQSALMSILPVEPPEYRHIPMAVDSPPMAVGYITAVERKHKPQLAFPSELLSATWCEVAQDLGRAPTPDEQRAAFDGEIASVCFRYDRASGPANPFLYRSVKRCADHWERCTIDELGDAEAMNDDLFAHFAGFSENYLLLYLNDEAPPGSAAAHTFGGGKPLAAGYHLFASRRLTGEEEQENLSCEGRAELQALESFNAAHGTCYANSTELHLAVLHEPQSTPDADTTETQLSRYDNDHSAPRLTKLGRELLDAETRLKIALGCTLGTQRFERIESPERAEIAVRIGRPDFLADVW